MHVKTMKIYRQKTEKTYHNQNGNESKDDRTPRLGLKLGNA